MFKKIQKHLLINHPLIWNLKIVPISILLLIFHIIFFVLGILNGELNFIETERNYGGDSEAIIIFFGVLSAIIILILWIVYYFKNNAFKSYYPKDNFSLFKEWLMILVISLLLCSFSATFLLGKNLRTRSYFSEQELKKRCEIISEASIFYDGSFQEAEQVEVKVNDTLKNVSLDYYLFDGKKYGLNSLLNKNVHSFSIFSSSEDSLRKIKVKKWLANNQKENVRILFSDFLKIAKEHQLKANIDEDKWLSLVYTYPDFESDKKVHLLEKDYYNNYGYAEEVAVDTSAVVAMPNGERFDTINCYIKYVGKEKFIFNKYYVPAASLEYNYDLISESYTKPLVDYDLLLITLYFALGLSLALFSFKVTSGKSWLIALVSLGIFNIVLGIISAISSTELVYLLGVAALIISIFIYILFVISRNKGKSISAILLNILIWSFGAFFPLLYFLTMILLKKSSHYYDYDGSTTYYDNKYYETYRILEDNIEYMLLANLIIIFLMMIFFSFKIKKWKGLAES